MGGDGFGIRLTRIDIFHCEWTSVSKGSSLSVQPIHSTDKSPTLISIIYTRTSSVRTSQRTKSICTTNTSQLNVLREIMLRMLQSYETH
jgi:hypothetical protein